MAVSGHSAARGRGEERGLAACAMCGMLRSTKRYGTSDSKASAPRPRLSNQLRFFRLPVRQAEPYPSTICRMVSFSLCSSISLGTPTSMGRPLKSGEWSALAAPLSVVSCARSDPSVNFASASVMDLDRELVERQKSHKQVREDADKTFTEQERWQAARQASWIRCARPSRVGGAPSHGSF
jgi:hypothetical protein